MSTKSRKKRKSIWKSKFYRVYFVLVALALVAIVIGTFWLQGVLRDYESAQPKYVAGDVAKLFENADYEAIYLLDTSAGQFEGDEALYLDNLRQLTDGKRVEWTAAFSADKNERKYYVNLDGERFATFTLTPSGQTTPRGNTLWQLASVTTLVQLQQATPEPEPTPTPTPEPPTQVYTCRITAPVGYAVTVDGVAVSADNATVTDEALFEADFLPPGVANPALAEYLYDALTPTPQIQAADETGAPMPVEAVEDKELTWTCPMKSDEAYAQQYGDAAIALAKQVAKFMNKDAKKKAIERVCAKGSPAESIFDNLSNTFATPHRGISFRDEAVSEFYVLADDCFTCRVSFDTILKTEKGDAVYPTAYTFCVIKDGEAGRLWNIKVY